MSFNWDMADLEGEDLATAVVLELAGHGSVLAASLVFSSEGDGDGLGTAKLSVIAMDYTRTSESSYLCLQGRDMRLMSLSSARLGESTKVCLQILQEFSFLQFLQ